jgi:hypothetical protein
MLLFQFIESIQNILGNRLGGQEGADVACVGMLGPTGREAWTAVKELWRGNRRACDALLAEDWPSQGPVSEEPPPRS